MTRSGPLPLRPPRDLARLGFLCLKGGLWKGKRLVPAPWIQEATTRRTATTWGMGEYGFHWWIPSMGGFAAHGYLGQAVYVFPAQDLLVVFTANLPPERAGDILDAVIKTHLLDPSGRPSGPGKGRPAGARSQKQPLLP